jgi:hypothetical protein
MVAAVHVDERTPSGLVAEGMVTMSYDESGVRIYQAGEVVSAGYYARVDDGSYHLVLLEQPGPLPPSFDGHVALYRAAAVPSQRVAQPAELAPVHAL